MQSPRELLMALAEENSRGSTEHALASYCLPRLGQLPDMGIVQLAEACHTSTATVTRFVRRMGYDNFVHFKDACRTYVQHAQKYWPHNATLCASPGLLEAAQAGATAEGLRQVVEAVWQGTSRAQLARMLVEIRAAEDILLLGMEFSYMMALYLQSGLYDRGKTVRVVRTVAAPDAVQINPNTLLVLISMSGNSLSYWNGELSRLRYRGKKLWLVTSCAHAEHYPQVLMPGDEVLRSGAGGEMLYQRYEQLALMDMILAGYGDAQQVLDIVSP